MFDGFAGGAAQRLEFLFSFLILVLFFVARIGILVKFRKDEAVSDLSKIIFILPTVSYVLIVLAAYLEKALSGREFFLPVSFLGFLFLCLGISLRNQAVKELGKSWNPHIEPKPNARLVTSGPYSFSRHPYYFSVLLELGGFCLLFNSFIGFFLLFVVHLPLLYWRINLEERTLLVRYKESYLRYRKKTPKIFSLSRKTIWGLIHGWKVAQFFDLLRIVGLKGFFNILTVHRRMLKYSRAYMTYYSMMGLENIGFLDELRKGRSVSLRKFGQSHDVDRKALKAVCDYLFQVRIFDRHKGGHSLTREGKKLLELSFGSFDLLYGYAPLFEKLDSLISKRELYNVDIFRREKFMARGSTALTRYLPFPSAKDLIKKRGFRSVVDLGCGDGEFLTYLCRKGNVRGVGVDLSDEVVELAAKRIKDTGLEDRVRVVRGDIMSLDSASLSDDSDLVCMMFVLHEFFSDGCEKGMEVLRRLKSNFPESHFLVCELVRQENRWLRKKKTGITEHHLFHRLSNQGIVPERKWKEIFEKAGFEIVTQKNFDFAGQVYFLLK